ncbi:MAG: HAMP domain-containing protein [Chloroflexi bacterium]|nr:HAMP domain-containing protein [Chloroflexota bacterium]
MKLDIRTKLLGGFGLVVALLVAVFVVGFMGLNSVGNATNKIVHEEMPQDIGVRELEVLVMEQVSDYSDFAITKDPEGLVSIEHETEAVFDHVLELETMFAADAESTDLLFAFAEGYNGFLTEGERFTSLVESGAADELIIEELHALGEEEVLLEAELNALTLHVEEQIELAVQGAESTRSTATTISVILSIVAAAVAIAIGFLLSQSISKGVNQVGEALNKLATDILPRLQTVTAAVADGDLTIKSNIQVQQVDVKSSDEIGAMARSLNLAGDGISAVGQSIDEMVEGLRGVIGGVTRAAGGVEQASSELASAAQQAGEGSDGIASAAQQVASGSEEQSQTVQETSRIVDELASAIASIADGSQQQAESIEQASGIVAQVSRATSEVANNAQEATNGARAANEAAEGGLITVRETVEGMVKITSAVEMAAKQIESLGEQSAEIGKIVGVIDDIAAQTNLLALNAAIEAARAGEQGRGFAVVADEVRTLAERVTDATKEISDLIQNVQSGVEQSVRAAEQAGAEVISGAELAEKSGQALEDIQKAVSGVTSQIEQISAASEEVSASADEMVRTIDTVNEITQQNTAATEQMSAASDGVKTSVDGISAVTEQASAAAQEMSASSEEVGAQVQQVVASSQGLSDMATSLREMVSRFRVEPAQGGNAPVPGI